VAGRCARHDDERVGRRCAERRRWFTTARSGTAESEGRAAIGGVPEGAASSKRLVLQGLRSDDLVRREACHWSGCIFQADDAVLDVTLVFEGRTHRKKRVPLCNNHLVEFGRTKRMNLRPEFLFEVEPR
jgi:hypothetical protein